jgi:hypothetical protein
MTSVPHPIASGDTFAYTGSLSKTYTQSAPCPMPTATSAATIGIQVTNSNASSPSGATDVQSVETDAFPTQTTTTTTHQIVQDVPQLGLPGVSSEFQLFSTSSSDSIGNTIATSYAHPQVLDLEPETQGAQWGSQTNQPFNDPTATINETLADGTRITRNVKNDGTYLDTETFVNNAATNTITIDGAANGKSIDGGGVYNILGTTFTYAAPAGGTITLTIASPGSPSKTRTFPAWFTVPSSSYISDTFVDNGSQTFDPNCSVNSSIGTSGNQIVETYSVLDPVLGYTETRTTTSYVVSGFGAACVKIDDALNSYYDYQNDTTKIDYQSQNGQPNSVDHIVEYLSMTAPTSPYPALRRPQSTKAISPLTVASHIAAIQHTRAIQVAKKAEALHAFATRIIKQNKGGVR